MKKNNYFAQLIAACIGAVLVLIIFNAITFYQSRTTSQIDWWHEGLYVLNID